MGAQWISARVGGRAPFLIVCFSFARVCVLLRKARRWRLPEDGIKVSPPSLYSGDASSIIGGRVEVCLRRIYLWWICLDLVVVRLRSCVFGLNPSNLRYSSLAAVAILVRWSYGALARQLPDYLIQQVLPSSGDDSSAPSARFIAYSRR